MDLVFERPMVEKNGESTSRVIQKPSERGVSWQPDLITLNSALRATSVEGHWRVAKVLLKAIRQACLGHMGTAFFSLLLLLFFFLRTFLRLVSQGSQEEKGAAFFEKPFLFS